MKELKVDFEMIGMAMEDVNRDLIDYYLDTENGQVIVLSDEASKYAGDDEYINIRDLPDWQIDEIKVAENILNNQTGRYVNIPEKPRFKNVLKNYPDYEKEWFAFKATKMDEEVRDWLNTIGIKPL